MPGLLPDCCISQLMLFIPRSVNTFGHTIWPKSSILSSSPHPSSSGGFSMTSLGENKSQGISLLSCAKQRFSQHVGSFSKLIRSGRSQGKFTEEIIRVGNTWALGGSHRHPLSAKVLPHHYGCHCSNLPMCLVYKYSHTLYKCP